MLVVSALHVHTADAALQCDDCAHHVKHTAHIGTVDVWDTDCVLCQFISSAYLLPAAVVVAFLPTFFSLFFCAEQPLHVVFCGAKEGRGPPVF